MVNFLLRIFTGFLLLISSCFGLYPDGQVVHSEDEHIEAGRNLHEEIYILALICQSSQLRNLENAEELALI
jgi:hypothetical protein